MQKTEILGRLNATYKMLLHLKKEQFNYANYVSHFSKSHRESGDDCGTVCCVAGWYPKYFPEAGLKWNPESHSYAYTLIPDFRVANRVEDALVNYHGLNDDVIACLFYGKGLKGTTLQDWSRERNYEISLEEVQDRFSEVYHLIINEEIYYK